VAFQLSFLFVEVCCFLKYFFQVLFEIHKIYQNILDDSNYYNYLSLNMLVEQNRKTVVLIFYIKYLEILIIKVNKIKDFNHFLVIASEHRYFQLFFSYIA
jgi:hypothetical protein